MEPVTFDSQDLDEVESFVSDLYSRMRIGASGERTHAHITRQVMTPWVAFDDLEYSFDVGYDAEPQPFLVVSDVVANSVTRADDGREEVFAAGDVFAICRPGRPYSGVVGAAHLRQLTLHPAALSQVASTGGSRSGPVRLLDHRPLSRRTALSMRRAITHVRDGVVADGSPSELVASAATQYLAARVLETFPNTAVPAPTATDRRDADPGTLRRATSYIEANPALDLTLADVARVAHVTPRALQLAFRRHLDTTPMAYLRRVRLHHAHHELLVATAGDGQSVNAIAARWGFTSSRFAEHYRAAYGRLPSATLRS